MFTTEDASLHESILRDFLREVAAMNFATPPPCVAQELHRKLRKLTGNLDPYAEVKKRYNELAMHLLPSIRKVIDESSDPFHDAVRYAIAGNVIDFGVNTALTEAEVLDGLHQTLEAPFDGDVDEFRRAVEKASSILYLVDNCGEIVLDRLLIEHLPRERVTVATRGAAILNDATMADAQFSGLTDLVKVIDNGSDAPGTVLSDCSEEFQELFRSADLVIAKGQGNFETLSGMGHEKVYFMFMVKCHVVAEHVGIAKGTQVLVPEKGKSIK